MAKTFLDEIGLSHLIAKIKTALNNKVSTVEGKGLSTNDYTNAEKSKLASISNNAEENAINSIQMNGNELLVTNKIVDIRPEVADISGLGTQLNSKVNTNSIVLGINKDATGFYLEVN